MPRLSAENGAGNLTLALSNLGLNDLFKPGLSNLYDISDYKWLSISDIIHKTFMDIRENTNPQQGVFVVSSTSTPQTMTRTEKQYTTPFSSSNQKIPFLTSVQFKPSTPTVQVSGESDRDVINVKFDKPFYYFVIDNISGLVIIMGKFGREPVTSRLPF
jgi:serine protease inhibitor